MRSPKEIANSAETVMVSLPTPDIVLKVATGPGGVIEGKKVKRFVDLSTTGSVMAQKIFKLLADRNIVQIDAPVSGGVRGAAKGTVAVMASGPRADVEAVEPALKVIGKFFYIGEKSGAGQTMKLCNNVLSAAATVATSESFVTGVKAGLDPRTMVDVINASSGRSTATEQKFPEVVIPRTFNQGFTAGLMLKDVNLFISEAKALGVPVQAIEAVAALLKLTCDELGSESDITEVIKPIEKRAGVEVRAPKRDNQTGCCCENSGPKTIGRPRHDHAPARRLSPHRREGRFVAPGRFASRQAQGGLACLARGRSCGTARRQARPSGGVVGRHRAGTRRAQTAAGSAEARRQPGGRGGRADRIGAHLDRSAMAASDYRRPSAGDARRYRRAAALPQCALDHRQAPGMARRAGDQRKRHGRHHAKSATATMTGSPRASPRW